MESFAFWYRCKQNKNAPEKKNVVSAVMNFNLWSQCGWDGAPLLDIGFKVDSLDMAEELYFFLPFSTPPGEKTKYIEDLGCKFQQTELVDAIFNESYATTIAANTKSIDVKSIDGKESFKIYQLDIAHDIELEPFSDGTILKIKTSNIISGRRTDSETFPTYYLRFRIKNHPLSFLIHQYSSPVSALQSIFHTTYMVDFRYHNIRSLDKTLIEKFSEEGNHRVNVSELHFLLMTKAYVDVTDATFKSIRTIERNVWKNYVDNRDTTDLVAYHYAHKPKERGENIPSSELFAKFRVEKSVVKCYVFLTILIGAVGSIVGSIVYEVLKCLIS